MQRLNTMETFEKNEFYIERDGVIFELTPEEMSDFMYLRKAIIGKHRLENYLKNHPEQKKIISQIMEDEEYCFELEDSISVRPGDDEFMDELYIDDLISRIRKAGELDE